MCNLHIESSQREWVKFIIDAKTLTLFAELTFQSELLLKIWNFTLSVVGGCFLPPPQDGKTAIMTHKSDDNEQSLILEG